MKRERELKSTDICSLLIPVSDLLELAFAKQHWFDPGVS